MKYKVVKPKVKPTSQESGVERRKINLRDIWQCFRRWASVVLLGVFVAATLFYVLPKLPTKPYLTSKNVAYKGVLEMWNIECFEGGVGSRQSWLTACAAKFEAKNKGLYVHVTTLTAEQAADKLSAGEKFDLVSFSRGTGATLLPYLAPTNAARDMPDNMRQSATVGNVVYANAYYCGAYLLFSRSSELAEERLKQECLTKTVTRKIGKNTVTLSPMVCGFTQSNSPLTALLTDGCRGNVTNLSEEVTQYRAYEAFVSHKSAVTLLGTQRDLYRLRKREADGKIEPLAVVPLIGYTDLVQYVAVGKQSANRVAAETFATYLTSAEVQATLVDIALFSPTGAAVYTDDTYSLCAEGVTRAYVPNVFAPTESVAKQRADAVKGLEVSKNG